MDGKTTKTELVSSPTTSSSAGMKACQICRTTKTPLWRGGPSGPKSLCNACGIRHRKKRRELHVSCYPTAATKPKKKENSNQNVLRLFLLQQRSSILKLRRRHRLVEEEEAAVLLMALSSGSLYSS
ncbi:GATA transcription factor 16 [Zostera marina]|uniref:GATA transcription factor 16 n=1 Tax=Zostera marina TaxID=29655 RepID=A0A0K9PP63_ZOSMR|nr:GATA transcription factor 16 [Zostera marina]